MRFDLLSIFPAFFTSPLEHGVVARAVASGHVDLHLHDLRAFTHDRHRTVDDRPFGGGEGMVLKPEPILRCAETLALTSKPLRDPARESVILLSPQGRPFTQAIAAELAALDRIVLLCGRYEGIDERIHTLLCDRELSVGDYVLSGGELPALLILDAVVRLLPGVLGNPDSSRHESFTQPPAPPRSTAQSSSGHSGELPASTHATGGLLDCPHYTRPAIFQGLEVPAVLQNGNHIEIRRWRRHQSLRKTRQNRPDLLLNAELTDDDRRFLATLEPEA